MKQALSLLLLAGVLGCASTRVLTEDQIVQRLQSLRIYPSKVIVDADGLVTLDLARSGVSDLSVLNGMPIAALNLYECPVFDLSPVRTMPIKKLSFNRTLVTDVGALAGLGLDFVVFDTQFITNGMKFLREMRSLSVINGSPEDFWQRYDAGKYPSQGHFLMRVVQSKKRLKGQSEAERHASLWKMIWIQRGYSTTNGAETFYLTPEGQPQRLE